MNRLICLMVISFGGAASSQAAIPPHKKGLDEGLEGIRAQIVKAQSALLESSLLEKTARERSKQLKHLITLQKKERVLLESRQTELQSVIIQLETRRSSLLARSTRQQAQLRKSMLALHRSIRSEPGPLKLLEQEAYETPHRKILVRQSQRMIADIETLKVDLRDADELDIKIQAERDQMNTLVAEAKDHENLLRFHAALEQESTRQKLRDRVEQLKAYRDLKAAESEVESLISQFNARQEIDRVETVKKEVSKSMRLGEFERLKGKLPLPVEGRIQGEFGQTVDPKTQATVFKKGIEIRSSGHSEVKSIASGKVVFAGELPGHGRVIIVDHGNHYYSLYGRLGVVERKVGEAVASGDRIGVSDPAGTPIYFEIRARNVAVNPLQWVSGSAKFST